MASDYLLKLLQNKNPFESRQAAKNALDLYRYHKAGQPIVAIYESNGSLNCLFAVGVRESNLSYSPPGLGCYTIINDLNLVDTFKGVISINGVQGEIFLGNCLVIDNDNNTMSLDVEVINCGNASGWDPLD